jgi:hypothetical protein
MPHPHTYTPEFIASVVDRVQRQHAQWPYVVGTTVATDLGRQPDRAPASTSGSSSARQRDSPPTSQLGALVHV